MLQNASVQEQYELVSKFDNFDQVLSKIETLNSTDVTHLPVFNRLNATARMTNQLIEQQFKDNYGMTGINYDNLE
jgi:hypothetical protein